MEEDIKKCETLLGSERWVLGTQDKKAIGNLIKGYRDGEDILKNITKENLELKEYIRELEESNKILQDLYWNECIPKSKIKKLKEENEKKIEAMRQFKHSSPFDFGLLNGIDDCCRTLLGEN